MEDLTLIKHKIQQIDPLEKKVAQLDTLIADANAETGALLEKYEKESVDVQKIQRENLSSFILKTFKKYEKKVQKEEREALEAKLNYDRAAANLEQLQQTKYQLAEQLIELYRLDRKYQDEIGKRRQQLIANLSSPDRQTYLRYDNEMGHIVAQITEVNEALSAAAAAYSTAREALDSLESAQGWSTFDLFVGDGLITHLAKYSHIDEAEDVLHQLSSQIEYLRVELADIESFHGTEFEQVSGIERGIDFFFDNVFTDFSVHSQIKDNVEQLDRLMDDIKSIEETLNNRLDFLNAQLAEVQSQQEDFLASL